MRQTQGSEKRETLKQDDHGVTRRDDKSGMSNLVAGDGATFTTANPEAVGFAPQRLSRLDSHLRETVERGEIPGLNALILRRGKLAYAASIGMSDIAAKKPMRADTIFRIYSMSKPVTSVAAAILLEEGRLLLNDPVRRFLPELGAMKVAERQADGSLRLVPQNPEMTIAELMTHTSGLTYGGDERHPVDAQWNAAQLFRRDGTIQEVVTRLATLPLKYQPGKEFEYSISHDILGALIERASGMQFGAFLSTKIFGPLGMSDTGFSVPHDKLSRLATLYEPAETGGLKATDASSRESRWAAPVTFEAGGAGLVSTVSDFVRFCAMLMRGGELGGTRILSRKSVEILTKNRLSEAQRANFWMKGYGYGLGFGVLLDPAANANLGTPGEYTWAGSASTYFWNDPQEDIIALLFAQLEPSSHSTIPRRFKALMYQALD
jgi:CubicO group peptidase (beta-lactamase class C family)